MRCASKWRGNFFSQRLQAPPLFLIRFRRTTFPQTHCFPDDAEFSPEHVLTESVNTSGHQNQIRSCASIVRRRVVPEEGDDRFPKADGGLGLVALPAVVDFAKDADLGGGLPLGMAGEEPAISQVCAQRSGILAGKRARRFAYYCSRI